MSAKYPYSKELSSPLNLDLDYDITALLESGKLQKAASFFRKRNTQYRSKKAQVTSGTFASVDGTSILYYQFTPNTPKERYPAIIYYHGGGFMFPIQKVMMDNSALFAENCGTTVFLPDYRIAPEVSCKEILEDCYGMFKYVFEHADELHVDPDKIIVYGDSAGGCLAASVVIQNRKQDGFPLRGQMLIYPVCDNESTQYTSVKEYSQAAWTQKSNIAMWRYYFADVPNAAEEYVPMRNVVPGLPRAYVEPLEMDILRDEAIAYANKLKLVGVQVECNLIGGAFHGYDSQLKSPLVKRVFQHRYEVIRDMLG